MRRIYWPYLINSFFFMLVQGIFFFGSIMAAGCLFWACEAWWKLSGLIAFAIGCVAMPPFVLTFREFQDAIEDPIHMLRWRCQRFRAALHEPPPEE